MKITHLTIQNFLAVRHIDIELTRPIMLFAGSNEVGKSSIQEAIRMAFTEEAVRVKLKKEYPDLVRDGAKSGLISISSGDKVVASIKLPSGEAGEDLPEGVSPGALRFLVDASRFARIEVNARRSFLFKLMNVGLDTSSVVKRMAERKCDPVLSQGMDAHLKSGFEIACTYAGKKVTEYRGAWKSVTGETYGSMKAEGWSRTAPAVTDDERDELAAIPASVSALRDELAQHNQALGRQRAIIEGNKVRDGEISRLQTVIAQLKEVPAALAIDEEKLPDLQKRIKDTRSRVDGVQPGIPVCCPKCEAELLFHDGALAVKAKRVAVDKKAADSLAALERELVMVEQRIANGRKEAKKLAETESRYTQLQREVPEQVDEDAIAGIGAAIQKVDADIKALTDRENDLKAKLKAEFDARHITNSARENHQLVLKWSAIADALSPEGIPADLLGAALKPFNERLRQTSITTEWPQVTIDADMTIRAGGRLYNLMSESARWRVDAAIAEAISFLSNVRIVLLDRLDVNDLPNRAAALSWLDGLIQTKQIDTAIVCGTLKARPSGLPDSIEVRWIHDGALEGAAA